MLLNLYRVKRMRKIIRKERKDFGRCLRCRQRERCEEWCWGPRFFTYLKYIIKSHKISYIKFLTKNYIQNLKWAGTDPYHRYDYDRS